MRAALVDEDEVGGGEGGGLLAPGGALGLIAFGGDEGLFLSGQPGAASARDMVAALTCTPVRRPQLAQCSAKRGVRRRPDLGHQGGLAVGADAAAAAPAGGGRRPCRSAAAALRQRLIVLMPTPKSRAASAWGSPASMAPSSRSRRSAEYCFIPPVSHPAQLIRKPL